jgi:hypothetical protein
MSGTIHVGNTSLTIDYYRINPGKSGQLDIGTTTKPDPGINGSNITITSQPGSDYSGGLGPGYGGTSTLKGGTGGLGDGISVPSASGGDSYVEGGPPGANLGGGIGAKGVVYLGLNDTLSIRVGSINLLWNVDGGGNIGASGANRPDYIYAKTWVGAGASTVLKSDRISVSGATGDPGTLVAGDLWYRTDLGRFKFRNATTAVELLDSSSAITNPSTKATNDILQYTAGGAWDAVGGAVGDPVLGVLHTQGQTLVGTANASPLLWNTDNANDIGASGATRPRTIYAGTSVVINGQTAMKATDATGGDLSGTYPSTLTVAKVQGYSMTSGAPAKGDAWQFDGTNWIHDRSRYRVLAYGATSFNSASGEVTVCSYATGASEFTANSMVHMIFVVKNGSNPQIACRSYYGGTKLTDVGAWTYSHNKVDIWDWVAPDNTSNCQYYYDHYGGVGTTDLAVGANWMTTGATWSARIQNTNAGGGTTYVRAWIIELHQGA